MGDPSTKRLQRSIAGRILDPADLRSNEGGGILGQQGEFLRRTIGEKDGEGGLVDPLGLLNVEEEEEEDTPALKRARVAGASADDIVLGKGATQSERSGKRVLFAPTT